jgi:hypothetical protein
VALEVGDSQTQDGGVIAEEPEAGIALVTEQASDADGVGRVVVIHVEELPATSWHRRRANGATSALGSEHAVVALCREPVLYLEVATAIHLWVLIIVLAAILLYPLTVVLIPTPALGIDLFGVGFAIDLILRLELLGVLELVLPLVLSLSRSLLCFSRVASLIRRPGLGIRPREHTSRKKKRPARAFFFYSLLRRAQPMLSRITFLRGCMTASVVN